jgi:hypothetical protein
MASQKASMTRAHSSGLRVRGICAVCSGARLEMNCGTAIEVSFDAGSFGRRMRCIHGLWFLTSAS